MNRLFSISLGCAVLLSSGLPSSLFATPVDTDVREQTGDTQRIEENQKEDVRARFGTKADGDMTKVERDVQTMIHDMVASVLDGDTEDFVDYIAEEDRDRIEEVEYGAFNGLSDNMRQQWQQKYNKDIFANIEKIRLPLEVNAISEDRAQVVLKGENDRKHTLQLVRGGIFNTGWRIDVADNVTLRTIETEIKNVVEEFEKKQLSDDMQKEYVMLSSKILKVLEQDPSQISDEATRKLHSDVSDVSRELVEDSREIVRKMVHAALNGDLEDYVDYLANADRDRIEQKNYSRIAELSDQFRTSWEQTFQEDFSDGMDRLQIPVTVNARGENAADVTLKAGGETLKLSLVKGGWFNQSWRIDAPDTLDLTRLEGEMTDAVQKIEKKDYAGDKNAAYESVVLELLRPVSQKQ